MPIFFRSHRRTETFSVIYGDGYGRETKIAGPLPMPHDLKEVDDLHAMLEKLEKTIWQWYVYGDKPEPKQDKTARRPKWMRELGGKAK